MDLHFGDTKPTDEERAAVDAVLGPPASAWEGAQQRTEAELRWARGGKRARDRRDLLLPALHAVNDRVGRLSESALDYICRRLTVPPAEAYGVATFSFLFSVKPRPATVLYVCTDLTCAAKGSAELCASLADTPTASWERAPCLGLCERAPASGEEVGEAAPRAAVPLAPATPDTVARALAEPDAIAPEQAAGHAVPQAGQDGLVLLKRVRVVHPYDLDDYRSRGGRTALRRAFALGPAGVIREVLEAGLLGRGGAAFPTGRKWEATAGRPERVHYLVCNADESEPGTFKDRVLMEGDPYAVVEAMTIAGCAVGAERGYLYLRGEYPRAHERLSHAITRARERGLLGPDVLGQGYAFDIEIRSGAGAYICGEETAIFNSIEGRRGEPRSKPPFPVEKGLFGLPTAVNNVETLVNVLPILEHGAEAYARAGTGASTGTKLFCVSGNVARPGVYELPFGASLRELIALCGPPERMRAVLLGGAAGGFVRPDELDIPLTFEGTRGAGTTPGSGVVLVLDDSVELPRILLRIAESFRDESCGQCVPCRVGTVRQEEALHRIRDHRGAAAADDIALLRDVGRTLPDASICGLGQTAWNAVESAIDRLRVFE
ncbi:NADH-ubiquinone oxidoreductase-F iron-sulfur binding region domain-containing protein [Streptomyces hundungensis]|uniref:NADH-ubiquinone oxidoreductase-F iron-sulfur binding region domain-containing protein n=1 Tax=Streptomyces hundungensis TaxID=1077946 RepID=UPI0033F1D014